MRQRPGSFFFCSIGHMVQRTLLIAAAPHHQGEVNQSPKGHEGALGMVRHPEPLPTAHALLMERREVHFSLCRGTCFSSGHLVAPVFRSLVFLPPVSSSCQDRFAILVFFLRLLCLWHEHLTLCAQDHQKGVSEHTQS